MIWRRRRLTGGCRRRAGPTDLPISTAVLWPALPSTSDGPKLCRVGGQDTYRGGLGTFLVTAGRFGRDHAALPGLLGLNCLRSPRRARPTSISASSTNGLCTSFRTARRVRVRRSSFRAMGKLRDHAPAPLGAAFEGAGVARGLCRSTPGNPPCRVEIWVSVPSQCEGGQRGRCHTRSTPWPRT